MNTQIQIVSKMTGPYGSYRVCGPFHSEKSALTRARKIGAEYVIAEPEGFYSAVWYVVLPVDAEKVG